MSLKPQLLQSAIARGRTQWLKDYLIQHLPSLDLSSSNYQAWFDNFLQALESRGLSQPSQQKNYLTDVRNAIKVLDPNHSALNVVKFSRETWVEINNHSSERIQQRPTKLIEDPDAVVNKAIELVKTFSWSNIAAGLAVLTGRRCCELLKTAEFEYRSQYSVIFRGASKRRGEPIILVFEIPTLCQADLVVEARNSLKMQLGEEIQHLSMRQVNQRYEERVAQKCERHFNSLVPPRNDGDDLYTHLFKAVYSTIACHWYCPVTVPKQEYCAAIQGHYQMLKESNQKLRRVIASNRNYHDYQIADGLGNIDGRLGIRLGWSGVEVIDQFQLEIYQSSAGKTIEIISRRQNRSKPTSTRDRPHVLPSKSKLVLAVEKQGNSNSRSTRIKSNLKHQSTTMNDSNHLNEAVVSLQLSLSRLENFSQLLALSQSQAIASLVDWAEAGASLANHFNLDGSNPETLTSHVLELEQNYASVSNDSQSQSSNSTSREPSSSVSAEDHQRLILSVSSLSNSVEFLTRALMERKSDSKDSKVSGLVNNSSQPRSNNNSRVSSSAPATPQAPSDRELSSPNSSDVRTSEGNSVTNESRARSRRSIPENRERDSSEVMNEDINNAIDAIMDFNDAPERPHKQKFRLSVKPISDLTNRANNSVSKVLKERSEEIEKHHQQHQISAYHNKSRKNEQGDFYPPIESEPEIRYERLTEVITDSN